MISKRALASPSGQECREETGTTPKVKNFGGSDRYLRLGFKSGFWVAPQISTGPVLSAKYGAGSQQWEGDYGSQAGVPPEPEGP